MATHSSNLAWEIPWTEEPGGLHNLVTKPPKCVCVCVCVLGGKQCTTVSTIFQELNCLFMGCVYIHLQYVHAKSLQSYLTVQAFGLQPTRICPWDSPGKNTGVGCHALLIFIFIDNVKQYSKVFAPKYHLLLDSQIPSWILPQRLRNIQRRET